MKTVKVGFSASWERSDPDGDTRATFLSFLSKYDVRIVPPREADYLFFSVFNGDHHGEAHERSVKILFTGENYCPDFNACDYALSFEYLDYGDRHLRLPLYLLYSNIGTLADRPTVTLEQLRARKHFCNFIYSNGEADPRRDALFNALNRKMPVHSAGRHLTNTQGVDAAFPGLTPNLRKRRYMEDFRFSLACENSSHPGYVTEKIADAFIARTIPIYWGDPKVADEFNEAAFVNTGAFPDLEAVIDHVTELSRDEERMLAMLNASPLKQPDQLTCYWAKLQAFFERIFDQDLAVAQRRPAYGFGGNLQIRRRKDAIGHRRLFKRNRV